MTIGTGLTVWLSYSAVLFGLAALTVVVENLRTGHVRTVSPRVACLLPLGAGALAWAVSGEPLVAIALAITQSLLLFQASRRSSLTTAGLLLLWGQAQVALIGLAWTAWFLVSIRVSDVTRILMFATYPLLAVTVLCGIIQATEQWDVFVRRRWRRARLPLEALSRDRQPLVSIHVPAHAEPPDVVIATLDSLATLDYANFEVLVIDNNTNDERLWRPVERRCRELGGRFRFFHVEPMSGAKAGALNFALRNMSPDAEFVAIVDADYEVESDFLSRLVGFFDDPKMGFVQTPHDYRDWESNAFLRQCYWEYRYFFETNLVSQNERDSAIVVGTMCVLRRSAVEEAGGWAEWCATEDSELAIRIHALGYSSLYLNFTFGRGLIPETFASYRRQRHRWTAGPVQEFKRHWRLFLPWPLARRSELRPLQKLHHLNHGIENIAMGVSFVTVGLGAAIVASMSVHHEVVAVPFALWLTATVVLATSLIHWWLVYGQLLGRSLWSTVGAYMTSKSLTHIRGIGSLDGILHARIPWHRTNKFKELPSAVSALLSAQAELLVGCCALALGILALVAVPSSGLLRMLGIGALIQSAFYLSAPALALLGDRQLRAGRPDATDVHVRQAADRTTPTKSPAGT